MALLTHWTARNVVGHDKRGSIVLRQKWSRGQIEARLPEYSVHDIVRIGLSKKKLMYFVDHNIFALDDVPHDFELGDGQTNQVLAHKRGKPSIDEAAIRFTSSRKRSSLHRL